MNNLKVAIAQIKSVPGNIEYNTDKIIHYITKAKEDGTDIVVFPESTVTGYMCLDYFLNQEFIENNFKAVKKIAKYTQGITAIIGFVDFSDELGDDGTNLKYNSAAILEDGKIKDTVHKTILPNYDIFSEKRYYVSGDERKVFDCKGVKYGVQICADLWDENHPIKITHEQVKRGADLIINLSASNFFDQKKELRYLEVFDKTQKYQVDFIYVNVVGCYDGYRGQTLFDGHSFVMDKDSKCLKSCNSFAEDYSQIDFAKRNKTVDYPFDETKDVYEGLIYGIRQFYKQSPAEKAFIRLGKNYNSALLCELAMQAVGQKNLVGIVFENEDDSITSKKVAEKLGIEIRTLKTDNYIDLKNKKDKHYLIGLRNLIIDNLVLSENGVLLSSVDKTDLSLGINIKNFGESLQLAPINDLHKNKIIDVCKYVNQLKGEELISGNILKRKVKIELEEGDLDKEIASINIDILSELIEDIIAQNLEIKNLYKKYGKELVLKIFDKINSSEYKRRLAPPGIKVMEKSFGNGRRMPVFLAEDKTRRFIPKEK
jgi:NAD+ synthase (glutamine-hydrolysing)